MQYIHTAILRSGSSSHLYIDLMINYGHACEGEEYICDQMHKQI